MITRHDARTLNIEVYVDLICPWCLIGKSHLRRALDRLVETDPDVNVDLRWHSVQLAPDVPADGWPFAEFYERRLGDRHAVQARQAQVRSAAAQAGVSVDFSSIRTFPNTAKAHRLLALGTKQLDQSGIDRLLDRLFSAYFQRGEDLGDVATLIGIAAEHGIEADRAQGVLAERGNLRPSVDVQGVPYFVFNRRFAVSGAQPPELLHSVMRKAIALNVQPTASSALS
jgi:predicted DsbA family dithiol-disulfide isomerase